MQEVVVVLNGPHQKCWSWARGWHEVFWDGRMSHGIRLALDLELPILPCGDANGGHDLQKMVDMAEMEDLEVVPCRNDPKHKNTYGDCCAAIDELQRRPDVTRVHLVTCWYHMPRAIATMRNELSRQLPDRQIVIEPCIVWARFLSGIEHILPRKCSKTGEWKYGELGGLCALWLGRQIGARPQIGKPDLRDAA